MRMEILERNQLWMVKVSESESPKKKNKVQTENAAKSSASTSVYSKSFNKFLEKVTEDWNFLPRVVDELAKLDEEGNNTASMSKEDLHRHALDCKRIYEEELNSLDDEWKMNSKINEEQRSKSGRTNAKSSGANEYDSDETIEMTEQEIDQAYKTLSSMISEF